MEPVEIQRGFYYFKRIQESLEGSWILSRESWNFYKNWKDPERFKVLTAPEGFGQFI